MTNKNIVVLISGNGSNLAALIEAQKQLGFGGSIKAVISNRPEVLGLSRAENAGIPAITLNHQDFDSREAFDDVLLQTINRFEPSLIILAGFMRILTKNFVTEFRGRLLNIHPSLLPKYPGLNTHRKALENHDKYHGTSVHFVTEELDGGPIIAQAKTEIKSGDNEQSLLAKIQKLEHQLYPSVAKLILNEQIELRKDKVYFEKQPLEKPLFE